MQKIIKLTLQGQPVPKQSVKSNVIFKKDSYVEIRGKLLAVKKRPQEKDTIYSLRGQIKKCTFILQQYQPTKVRKYAEEIRQAARNLNVPMFPEGVPLEIEATFFFKFTSDLRKHERVEGYPRTKEPDNDNLVKQVMDALQGVLYVRDGQVSDTYIHKRYSATPRVEIEIRTIDYPGFQEQIAERELEECKAVLHLNSDKNAPQGTLLSCEEGKRVIKGYQPTKSKLDVLKPPQDESGVPKK